MPDLPVMPEAVLIEGHIQATLDKTSRTCYITTIYSAFWLISNWSATSVYGWPIDH
jgi:hypothetical protein